MTVTNDQPLALDDLDRARRRLSAAAPDRNDNAHVFANTARLFTHYRVSIQFRDRVMGGVPRDPRVIEGWLRSKAGVTDQDEIIAMTRRTLIDLGQELPETATIEEMIAASEKIAAERSTNGFKRGADGLILEGRQIKAALKEATHILYAGERWGVTKKGPKSFLAERVFVLEDEIPLGRAEPDGVHLMVGHVSGPGGPRSTLTYHEYCERPSCVFTVLSAGDAIDAAKWAEMLTLMQENGIGALRSQQHGRFDVTDIARVHRPQTSPAFVIRDDFS